MTTYSDSETSTAGDTPNPLTAPELPVPDAPICFATEFPEAARLPLVQEALINDKRFDGVRWLARP